MEQQPYRPPSESAPPQEIRLEGRVQPLLATLRNVLAIRQQRIRKHNNPALQTTRINVVDEYDNTFEQCLEDRWHAPQFDLEKTLQEEQGTFVEIGGPTPGGYELFPYAEQYQAGKLSVSNIDPQNAARTKLVDAQSLEELSTIDKLDQEIDARELPFENNSIPGLLSNALPNFVYEKYIPEAYRVLKPDGLLVMELSLKKKFKKHKKQDLN